MSCSKTINAFSPHRATTHNLITVTSFHMLRGSLLRTTLASLTHKAGRKKKLNDIINENLMQVIGIVQRISDIQTAWGIYKTCTQEGSKLRNNT